MVLSTMHKTVGTDEAVFMASKSGTRSCKWSMQKPLIFSENKENDSGAIYKVMPASSSSQKKMQ